MKAFSLVLCFLFISPPAFAIRFEKAQTEKEPELTGRELAVSASLKFTGKISPQKWKKCIPQESFAFPEKLTKELSDKIFVEKELQDLMKCGPDACAFNFLPQEVKALSKLKNEEKRKEAYFNFFKNRTNGKTPMDPNRTKWLLRSDQTKAFKFCKHTELDRLLDKRPLNDVNFRMSHVNYDSRMRPTTRVVQGLHYSPDETQQCYAEAVIFADHYDADRVEVWGINRFGFGGEIKLLIRHRIDFLSSWVRRLQKGSLRKTLLRLAKKQLKDTVRCLDD